MSLKIVPCFYTVVVTHFGHVKVHSIHDTFKTAHVTAETINQASKKGECEFVLPFVQPVWTHIPEESILHDHGVPEGAESVVYSMNIGAPLAPEGFGYCEKRNVYVTVDKVKKSEEDSKDLAQRIEKMNQRKFTQAQKKRAERDSNSAGTKTRKVDSKKK